MKTKSLIETNPYLKDPNQRQELIDRSVRTSGGVEGIKVASSPKSGHIKIPRRDKKIYGIVKQRIAAK